MVRAVAMLPLAAKVLIGLAILIEFVVITQWEHLTVGSPPAATTPKATLSPQKPEQRSFDFPDARPDEKIQAAAIEADLAKRMARVVIDEPNVEANGSIIANGQAIYLYGIKQFDSKKVCTKASGDRWACGLHAYATLRNSIAHKKIICDPKTILPNGVSAICRLAATDIALTLVRDGLAELDGNIVDAEMVKAQAFARSQKLGIWDR
jgi:endonuclease YncB( thermonuclease family)